MDRPPPPTRRFFMHVQKTAGMSLYLTLLHSLDPVTIYPNEDDGPKVPRAISVDHLLQRWAVRRDEIRLVSGHFPLCTTELLDAPFQTFTILREPVARTLSYLRYHRQEIAADRDKSLEEIYENPWVFHGLIHNHMVKMLAIDVAEMTSGSTTGLTFTPEHLPRAKARLAAMDLVGLQEQYEAFWAQLEPRFGWQIGPPRHTNRTSSPRPRSRSSGPAPDLAGPRARGRAARCVAAPKRWSLVAGGEGVEDGFGVGER
jgi:hypothetical protein